MKLRWIFRRCRCTFEECYSCEGTGCTAGATFEFCPVCAGAGERLVSSADCPRHRM